MFLHSDMLARERHDEFMREAEKMRLVRIVTSKITDKLEKHGAALFSGKPADKTPKTSKN